MIGKKGPLNLIHPFKFDYFGRSVDASVFNMFGIFNTGGIQEVGKYCTIILEFEILAGLSEELRFAFASISASRES